MHPCFLYSRRYSNYSGYRRWYDGDKNVVNNCKNRDFFVISASRTSLARRSAVNLRRKYHGRYHVTCDGFVPISDNGWHSCLHAMTSSSVRCRHSSGPHVMRHYRRCFLRTAYFELFFLHYGISRWSAVEIATPYNWTYKEHVAML